MLTKFKENQRVERWKDTPFRDILAVEWEKPTVVDSLGPINAVLPEEDRKSTRLNSSHQI